ncbi:putative phage-associated protein [Bradyrhizobium sp. AZCC 1578]
MPAPYDSRAVANEILRYAHEKGRNLTIMQLIKLVYVANGWSLALLNHRLIDEPIQAWQYGPVIPTVYQAFNKFGSRPINEYAVQAFSNLAYRADFDPEDLRLIHTVVDSYGHMHAFQLSNSMHQPGTPWTITRESKGAYATIDPELIKSHFLDLKKQRNVAYR